MSGARTVSAPPPSTDPTRLDRASPASPRRPAATPLRRTSRPSTGGLQVARARRRRAQDAKWLAVALSGILLVAGALLLRVTAPRAVEPPAVAPRQ
jgi:hypothetical protein